MALTDMTPERRVINRIILHSSKSDIGTANSIELLHKSRGMKDIGYHFVIERDGHVAKGRDVAHVGEHTVGHNLDSIGICLVGKEGFTNDQLISLGSIMQALLQNYPSINKVLPHKALNKQGCWFIESTWWDSAVDIITQ